MAVRVWHSQDQEPGMLCFAHVMMPFILLLLPRRQVLAAAEGQRRLEKERLGDPARQGGAEGGVQDTRREYVTWEGFAVIASPSEKRQKGRRRAVFDRYC